MAVRKSNILIEDLIDKLLTVTARKTNKNAIPMEHLLMFILRKKKNGVKRKFKVFQMLKISKAKEKHQNICSRRLMLVYSSYYSKI